MRYQFSIQDMYFLFSTLACEMLCLGKVICATSPCLPPYEEHKQRNFSQVHFPLARNLHVDMGFTAEEVDMIMDCYTIKKKKKKM